MSSFTKQQKQSSGTMIQKGRGQFFFFLELDAGIAECKTYTTNQRW